MTKKCIFCDRSKFEERVIYENEYFYVIATLGQITDGGHVLLLPKLHVLCVAAMTEDFTRDSHLELMIETVALAIEQEWGVDTIAVFEHGIAGQTIQHSHVHLMPAKIDFGKRICNDYQPCEIDTFSSLADLQRGYGRNPEPYLFWADPDGTKRVCWRPNAPPQILRVIAAEELDRPERANWQTMDAGLDKQLWSDTVTRLKPYFL